MVNSGLYIDEHILAVEESGIAKTFFTEKPTPLTAIINYNHRISSSKTSFEDIRLYGRQEWLRFPGNETWRRTYWKSSGEYKQILIWRQEHIIHLQIVHLEDGS